MTLRAFIVEDQQRMQALLRELFDAVGGIEVVATAGTEAEAMLWLDEHPGQWDVAVVDLLLDQGSGMGVVLRCKATHPGGHVVVFSNYASPAVRRHCHELGAQAVFDKSDSPGFIEHFVEMTRPAA